MTNSNQPNKKGAKAYQSLNELSRNEEIKRYASLVKRIALHLKSRLPPQVDVDDLIQAGMIGLVDALQNFKTGQGATFETYASIRIRGSMIDQLRQNDWTPRSVHVNVRAIREAKFKLEHDFGREPSDIEVAEYLGIDIERYHQMVLEGNTSQIVAIEDTGLSSDVISERPLSEILGQSPEDKLYDNIYKKQFKDALAKAMSDLPERERILVSLYYDQELNLREIGIILGISESRTCQLLSNAIEKLRESLEHWNVNIQKEKRVVPPLSERLAPGAKPINDNKTSILFREIEEKYQKEKQEREQEQLTRYRRSLKYQGKVDLYDVEQLDSDEEGFKNPEDSQSMPNFFTDISSLPDKTSRRNQDKDELSTEERQEIYNEQREALDSVRPLVPKLKNVSVKINRAKTNVFKHS